MSDDKPHRHQRGRPAAGLHRGLHRQAQPLVHDGVVCIVTGENDAFAVSVDTGAVLWERRGNVDPQVARPCCSWPGRGVGLGDGREARHRAVAQPLRLRVPTAALPSHRRWRMM